MLPKDPAQHPAGLELRHRKAFSRADVHLLQERVHTPGVADHQPGAAGQGMRGLSSCRAPLLHTDRMACTVEQELEEEEEEEEQQQEQQQQEQQQ